MGNQQFGQTYGDRSSIWIVIPGFNEGQMIASTLASIRPWLPNVVVVDDGSSDNTAEEATRAGAHVVRHTINLGQGAALGTGIRYALQQRAQWIVTFDADGQHRPEDIDVLFGWRGRRTRTSCSAAASSAEPRTCRAPAYGY